MHEFYNPSGFRYDPELRLDPIQHQTKAQKKRGFISKVSLFALPLGLEPRTL